MAAAAAATATTTVASTADEVVPGIKSVVVHPLVLLNVTDHYNRVARDTRKRVVGVLVGETFRGKVDIVNSFAVPFEEDLTDPRIWYFGHQYMEKMYSMFRKVTTKEKLVGFYSSGPKVKPADAELDELMRRYIPHPIFLVVDVRPAVEGLPIQAYVSKEVSVEGERTVRQFEHLPSSVGAGEAEEVAVEHLLRDVNDPSVSELGASLRAKLEGLRGLEARLKGIASYLDRVAAGELPMNHEILSNVQTMLALLPNLRVDELSRALQSEVNDMHLALFVGSLVRSVIGLHDLASNRLRYRHLDAAADATTDEAADDTAAADKADKAGAKGKDKAGGESESKRDT